MEGSTKGHRGRAATLAGASLLLTFFFVALPSPALAANYGSDVYGGGAYNVGVVPTPAVTPAPATGGGAIGGPFGVGYVTPSTATTSAALPPPLIVTPPASSATDNSELPFARSLQFRDRHPDVKRLQRFLNSHESPVAATGAGAAGNETDFFGSLTFKALVRYQNTHADEILRPSRLTVGTGYFGPSTRAFVNRAQN